MRILNISAQKPDSTGSGVYLAEMVRCQNAAGHEVAVVCGIASDDTVALPEGVQVYPVRFGSPNLPFPVCGMSDEMPYTATRYRDMTPAMVEQFCDAFAEVLREVDKQFQPDVVICHHLYLVCAVAREVLAHRVLGAVCHSTDLRQMNTHDLERKRIIEAVRNLQVIFALHGQQAQEIAQVYGVDAERIHVIGTGFNAAVFNTEGVKAASRGKNDEACVVYAGKIWRKKGVASLLNAIDEVHVEGRRVHLELAGGYNDAIEYESLRERAEGKKSEIVFLGRLSQTHLAEAYQRAEVFVLPSFFEGLPLVAIEALACGCKVVMTDLPGIRPWLEERVAGAPILYVEPPRMQSVDEPIASDLPVFERRLARALTEAFAMPNETCDLSSLSWESVTAQAVSLLHKAGN